jgi:hypothetical protein
MAKADKALSARRVDDVLRIRLDGAEFWDVVQFVREKQQEAGSAWFLAEDDNPLSDAMIRKYQERADKLVMASHEKSRKKLFRRHLAQRRALYAKAATSGDVRAALACLQDEAELLGLYPPKKIAPTNPTGDAEFSGGLSDEERLAALARLRAAVGARGGGANPPEQADTA